MELTARTHGIKQSSAPDLPGPLVPSPGKLSQRNSLQTFVRTGADPTTGGGSEMWGSRGPPGPGDRTARNLQWQSDTVPPPRTPFPIPSVCSYGSPLLSNPFPWHFSTASSIAAPFLGAYVGGWLRPCELGSAGARTRAPANERALFARFKIQGEGGGCSQRGRKLQPRQLHDNGARGE